MSYVIQQATPRGLVLNQISVEVLRIGRGTSAELRSDNPVVALEHAVIEHDPSGYTITDRGSITGTYVNRKPVESARLAKGDVIDIGDLRIEVQLADPARPMFLRIETRGRRVVAAEEEEAPAAPVVAKARGGVVKAEPVDYAAAYRLRRPFLTRASLTALAALITVIVAAQVIEPGNQTAFMPGGVSSAHQRAHYANGKAIEDDCHACHDPFKGVVDSRCQDCHQMVAHAPTQAEQPQCISCHAEHRGATKLALIPDDRCASCHADLQRHVKAGVVVPAANARVDSFGEHHPEFARLDDPNPLRFNHRFHLDKRGVLNASGKREVLQCEQCHKLVENRDKKLDPKPVTFSNDCRRCHRLTFDGRFPDAEVPHGGDPDLVYSYVANVYSQNRDILGKSPDEARRILATRSFENVGQSALMAGEHVIKTRCMVCHDVRRNAGRLAVTPPNVRTRWLQRVSFSHTPHSNLPCESCHADARKSANTADVLMPSKKDCTSCHGAGASRAADRCVTCHDYHGRSKTQLTKLAVLPVRSAGLVVMGLNAGMLNNFFLIAAVVLFLVIVIPVGLALFQRLKPRESERATPARPPARQPAAAPPPPPLPPLPSMAAPQAPAPARPAPPPPPPADEDATRIVKLDEPSGHRGTEMMQWYGMLVCTEGPLEGKRFMIEEDGLYIGRDAALSQVVINDSRISKRHVRIVPRDGKVHAIDQSSTNGTYLESSGAQRITDVQLKRGDKLILGDHVATFVYQI